MELSQNFLRAKTPCASGFRWFVRNQHDGNDYQRVLDALVADGRTEDARWLMAQFGPTDTVLEVDHLEADTVVFAGRLIVHGEVQVPHMLCVGRGLQAGAGIRVGRLEVGEDVVSGGAIVCGPLQAGGNVKAEWHIEASGDISADSLRCGWDLQCAGDLKLKSGGHIGQAAEVHGNVDCGKGLRAGGRIHIHGAVDVRHGLEAGEDVLAGSHLQAGWGIRALGDIRAAGSIRVGESLQADGDIAAGPGYGVYAGMNVQMQAWSDCAWVRARSRPQELISGHWQGQSD